MAKHWSDFLMEATSNFDTNEVKRVADLIRNGAENPWDDEGYREIAKAIIEPNLSIDEEMDEEVFEEWEEVTNEEGFADRLRQYFPDYNANDWHVIAKQIEEDGY